MADEADDDRTHKASIEERVRVTYAAPSGMHDMRAPVCDRVPADVRRTVRMRVHVFYEAYDDFGYDHDGNTQTPWVGAGNNTFDFTDTNMNGVHDFLEPSEGIHDISGDNAWNTVLGPVAAATARVEEEIERSNVAWAQAGIRFTLHGNIMFEDAIDANGLNFIMDKIFNTSGSPDDIDATVLRTTGATPNFAEVFFVAPIDPPSDGISLTPAFTNLSTPYDENTYLFVGSDSLVERRTLAHEFGHGLTNKDDPAPGTLTPDYVYFPTLDAGQLDLTVNTQRRALELLISAI